MAFLRLLRFDTVQHTWEWNGFTNVFCTSREGYHTFNPNTKSTVWNCTVFTKIKVEFILCTIHAKSVSYTHLLAFAVKKGENPELIEMFNNGLANLKKSGQYQKILDKYLKADSKSTSSTAVDETTIWGLLQNNYKQLLSGLGVTLALALLSFAIAMVIGVIFGMFSVSPVSYTHLVKLIK